MTSTIEPPAEFKEIIIDDIKIGYHTEHYAHGSDYWIRYNGHVYFLTGEHMVPSGKPAYILIGMSCFEPIDADDAAKDMMKKFISKYHETIAPLLVKFV